MGVWRGWRGWSLGFVAATFVAALIALQHYLAHTTLGGDPRYLRIFAEECLGWYLWLAATPVIFAFSRRFPFSSEGWVRSLAFHVLVSPVFVGAYSAVLASATMAIWPETRGPDWWRGIGFYYVRYFGIYILIYFATVALHHAFSYYTAYRDHTVRQSLLETELAQARLEALKMQVQPHFLFNTLHVISGLMARDVPLARRTISKLSELLRFSLESDATDRVRLGKEVELLERYVEIQGTRFGDRLEVEIEIDPDARDLLVPPMLLQPLVENSIRHGVGERAARGRIEIRARLEDDRLTMTVRDDGPGVVARRRGRNGVGLRSVRARLERMYGEDHDFRLENDPRGGALATIRVPARRERGA